MTQSLATVRRTGLALTAMLLCGCGRTTSVDPMLSARIGDTCFVYFRRDALGMAADGPSSPTTGNHNGAETYVSGKLVRLNAEWVTVSDKNREFSVPKNAILMLEVAEKK